MLDILQRCAGDVKNLNILQSEVGFSLLGRVIGYYKSSKSPSFVVFADAGMAVFTIYSVQGILYRDMDKIENSVTCDKNSTDAHLIVSGSKGSFRVPIDGRNGQFYDSFKVERFLRKAKFNSMS